MLKILQKDIIKIEILGVLVIILLLSVGNAVKAVRKVNAREKMPVSSDILKSRQSDSEVVAFDDESIYRRLQKKSQDMLLIRNPFTQAKLPDESVPSLAVHLSGILWDGSNPRAIINGVIVERGNSIGINTVTEIEKDRVILDNGLRNFELRIGE